MSLQEIISRIEFCSAQLHNADGKKIAEIKEILLDLQKQLEALCSH
jgi:hypothetical protein